MVVVVSARNIAGSLAHYRLVGEELGRIVYDGKWHVTLRVEGNKDDIQLFKRGVGK